MEYEGTKTVTSGLYYWKLKVREIRPPWVGFFTSQSVATPTELAACGSSFDKLLNQAV